MSKPLIGLTARTLFRSRDDMNMDALEMTSLGSFYLRGVEEAGGESLILPNSSSPTAPGKYVAMLDGLVLTGGPDVNPLLLGEEPIREMGSIDMKRDALEIPLAKEALKAGLPVFGICRGIQVMVIAAGGKIYQDIYSQAEASLKHRQKTSGMGCTHSIKIEKGCLLAEILGKTKTEVNTYHHQAVKEVPPSMRVTAHSPDGVIEAVEGAEREPFVLGIQWHAERLLDVSEDSKKLFRAHVEASERYMKRKGG